MSAIAFAIAESDSPAPVTDYFDRAFQRIVFELYATVKDWSAMAGDLCRFEKTRLLMVETPSAEDLEHHRHTLERLISLGEFLDKSTSAPEFPDRGINHLVAANLKMMKNQWTMWHEPSISDTEVETFLQTHFPE